MKYEKYYGISPRIAKWKIDTPFENWLSRKADKSDIWKKAYIYYYNLFDRKYYKKGVEMIKNIISQNPKKFAEYSQTYIVCDMLYCLHRFGISFQDYCIYDFKDKTFCCRNSFVSDKLRYYYCDILNEKHVMSLMTDKYLCYKNYRKFFKRDIIGCYGEEDRESFLSFVKEHNLFMFKPLTEHSGHGIKKVALNAIEADAYFSEMISKGAFVVEELIEQGQELAIMHPQSVNSLRVVTFVIGNKVNIIGVTWRIGAGNAITDNAGSGGMYASVDVENGFVQTDAVNYKGEHFNIHPDSKIQIVGYKLPKWEEALSLIHDMATTLKGTTLISWDIAYSNKGWLMIEANDNGDWSLMQSNKKIGKKALLHAYMDAYFKQK